MIGHKTTAILGVQVDSSQYLTPGYCKPQRFASYSYQINEILNCGAKSVLEIGPGNGVVTYLLRKAGIAVDTLDHDPALNPDIVASILELPLLAKSYDAILCCQVLEHLPWDMFPIALSEIKRVVRKNIIISLPDSTPNYYLEICLPVLGTRRFAVNVPKKQPMESDEHYWEIGHNVDEKKLQLAFKQGGLQSDKSYRLREFPYHHFYVLTVQ